MAPVGRMRNAQLSRSIATPYDLQNRSRPTAAASHCCCLGLPALPLSLPHRRYLNGFPDRPPVRPNISLGDSLAGLHAAFGAVMALLHRTRSAGGAAGQVGLVWMCWMLAQRQGRRYHAPAACRGWEMQTL